MSPLTALYWLLVAATAGSVAYCGIALFGAVRFLQTARRPAPGAAAHAFTPPVSLLKPLCGLDRELEENLRSFCLQDYPAFELLFSVREPTDPAAAVVQRLQKQFPAVSMRLLVTGPPNCFNAKVYGLAAMAEAAAHELLVITDSDVRVAPDYLKAVVAPMAKPAVGMVTCISRGAGGCSLWSRLEALSMNTQFVPGVLAAWLLMGMEFSLGPTMVIRKRKVVELGGFPAIGDYLADDFVLGQRVAESKQIVALAGNVPDHLVCNESLDASVRHRLRWERSSRRSRPAGYVGQLFMHTLPLALLAWSVSPPGSALGPILVISALGARGLLASVTCRGVLRDREFRRDWWLLPAQDLMSFAIWCWGFFGKEIEWRGTRFRVQKGGRLEAVPAARAATGRTAL